MSEPATRSPTAILALRSQVSLLACGLIAALAVAGCATTCGHYDPACATCEVIASNSFTLTPVDSGFVRQYGDEIAVTGGLLKRHTLLVDSISGTVSGGPVRARFVLKCDSTGSREIVLDPVTVEDLRAAIPDLAVVKGYLASRSRR